MYDYTKIIYRYVLNKYFSLNIPIYTASNVSEQIIEKKYLFLDDLKGIKHIRCYKNDTVKSKIELS